MKPDIDDKKEIPKLESTTDRPDSWLLHKWKNGDEQAAAVLFDRYALRLVALVASRLNRRYRSQIDPAEVMQSAMGSFFNAARASRIQLNDGVSLWRLLATFARRKLARSVEHHSAIKRGGGRIQTPLDQAENQAEIVSEDETSANEFVGFLKAELSADQFSVVEGLLAGLSQREVAKSLGIDERTVRRRVSRVRQLLSPVHVGAASASLPGDPATTCFADLHAQNLPYVRYNDFVLGKLIGSGGFGKVYRASMQSEGSTVAVKFLRKAFWRIEEARASFIREINAASRLQHPGILRYVGFGESPHGGPYVLSEWIEGKPMHRIDRPEKQRFIKWLRQICEAMQAVHHAGLVHGDLKPANILIDDHDRVTITDFGFSHTSVGGTCPMLGGTLGFAAPEQIDPAFGHVSPRTDIYAIGGLICFQLTGKAPNEGDGLGEILANTLRCQGFEAGRHNETSTNLHAILHRSLVSSPSERTVTIAEIMQLLSC
ncbi:MAG: protein kinase [Planctomycetota bacterium]